MTQGLGDVGDLAPVPRLGLSLVGLGPVRENPTGDFELLEKLG